VNDLDTVADIIELQVWATDEPYSKSSLQEDLEALWSDDDDEGAEDFAREIFELLKERNDLLDDAYPFICDGNVISPRPNRKADSSYLFCLGLLHFSDDVNLNLRTREFEEIVKSAAESYFGGEAVRIGAPWSTGQITDYIQVLELVSGLLPDIGPPTRTAAPHGGDGGWDIVLVKNFSDKKFSRLIALGNCATGIEDWEKKGQEKAIALFWSFFTRTPQSVNPCLTFLAVPFVLTEDEKLSKAYPNGITLDRFRVCEHAPSTSPAVMAWLDAHRMDALKIPLL
jgi:hypothetical protein